MTWTRVKIRAVEKNKTKATTKCMATQVLPCIKHFPRGGRLLKWLHTMAQQDEERDPFSFISQTRYYVTILTMSSDIWAVLKVLSKMNIFWRFLRRKQLISNRSYRERIQRGRGSVWPLYLAFTMAGSFSVLTLLHFACSTQFLLFFYHESLQ